MDLEQNAIVYHLLMSSDDGYETARKVYDNGGLTEYQNVRVNATF